MLTMITQHNELLRELNAVMYTAQNESEAVPSWRVYFFPTERERKKKRESLSSASSSSASWRRWWPIFSCFITLKPVFLFFCLFWREFVMKNMFWAYLSWKKKYAERGRSRTSLVFFTFVSHSLVRNVRCFCAGSKAMMTQYLLWSFTAYLIIASALSLRTYIRDTFFSLIRSLTQYFLHTHKNTHTDAHRKHSFRWKHAGCIERKYILW